MRECLHSNIQPHRGVAFLESLKFCWWRFGIDGALEAAASRRAKGTAERLYATKRITKRAEPFMVEHIDLNAVCKIGFTCMIVVLLFLSSC